MPIYHGHFYCTASFFPAVLCCLSEQAPNTHMACPLERWFTMHCLTQAGLCHPTSQCPLTPRLIWSTRMACSGMRMDSIESLLGTLKEDDTVSWWKVKRWAWRWHHQNRFKVVTLPHLWWLSAQAVLGFCFLWLQIQHQSWTAFTQLLCKVSKRSGYHGHQIIPISEFYQSWWWEPFSSHTRRLSEKLDFLKTFTVTLSCSESRFYGFTHPKHARIQTEGHNQSIEHEHGHQFNAGLCVSWRKYRGKAFSLCHFIR